MFLREKPHFPFLRVFLGGNGADNVFYHGENRDVVIGDMGLARQMIDEYYTSTYGGC